MNMQVRRPCRRWCCTSLVNGLVMFALGLLPQVGLGQPRVVAYYPGWMKSKLPAPRVKFEYITHLNHAFAWPLADGRLTGYAELNHPELVQEAHKAGRKILIALGGWGQSDGFAPMAADSASRSKFVQNLVDYCKARGYDGADLDWEFPQNNVDKANLTLLVKELRAAFDQASPPLLLTMVAVSSDWSGKWHDYAALAQHVAWFNVMTYDFHGSWTTHAGHNAPLYAPPTDYDGSVHTAIQYLANQRAIPRRQLHVGIPFYGKEFAASALYGRSTGAVDLVYSDIVPRLSAGWTYHWDEISKVPYLTNPGNTKVVSFDDSLSVSLKCAYAQAQGLAGVMIWALGQDLINLDQPLIEAVGRAFSEPGAVAEAANGDPAGFELLANYPNPFNAATTITFQLQREERVTLSVYTLAGTLAAELWHAPAPAGQTSVKWEASGCPSGVYFCRLESGNHVASRKMILIK